MFRNHERRGTPDELPAAPVMASDGRCAELDSDDIAELFADVAGQLIEVELMRRRWMAAAFVALVDLCDWSPAEPDDVEELPS